MSSTPANQDPALAPPAPAAPPPAGAPPADSAAAIGPPLDGAQIVQILRHFPNVYHVGLLPSFPPSLSVPSCVGVSETWYYIGRVRAPT